MWHMQQQQHSSSAWDWDTEEDWAPRHQWIDGEKGNRGPGPNCKDEGRYKKLMEDLKGARTENFELRQEQLEKLQEKNSEIMEKNFEIQSLQAEVDKLRATQVESEQELLRQKAKRKDSIVAHWVSSREGKAEIIQEDISIYIYIYTHQLMVCLR